MLLKEFKHKTRLTGQEIADMFGITHRQVYYYMAQDAEVVGKKKEKRIIKRVPDIVLATEQEKAESA